jgi:hypothetical protein
MMEGWNNVKEEDRIQKTGVRRKEEVRDRR